MTAMRYDVITLFPDLIGQICQSSIIGRAQKDGHIEVHTTNPRDFTHDVHRTVDDTPYGGGPGLVMKAEPVLEAYESLLPVMKNGRTILLSPWGRPFDQTLARELTTCDQMVLICGHYEGIDARVIDLIPNLELISLGDFVMTGGELAAACIIDATARLLPGVLGNTESTSQESFEKGLLEYPQYTKPAVVRGMSVPDLLRSGNHQAIASWRQARSVEVTQRYRPDLKDAGVIGN